MRNAEFRLYRQTSSFMINLPINHLKTDFGGKARPPGHPALPNKSGFGVTFWAGCGLFGQVISCSNQDLISDLLEPKDRSSPTDSLEPFALTKSYAAKLPLLSNTRTQRLQAPSCLSHLESNECASFYQITDSKSSMLE